MNQRALHYYEFGPFQLNATERLLQRGSDVVPLTPKVFDTLLVLVENCGHVLEGRTHGAALARQLCRGEQSDPKHFVVETRTLSISEATNYM